MVIGNFLEVAGLLILTFNSGVIKTKIKDLLFRWTITTEFMLAWSVSVQSKFSDNYG